MDSSYATARLGKPPLRFRYRTRALVAFQAFGHHGPSTRHPRVVDFGAAEALSLLELRELFDGEGDFVGIEYARDLVQRAPALPSNVELHLGDVTQLPPSHAVDSYDLVTSHALLEHLSDPGAALREAYRILKPGGLFVATVPSPTWDSLATRLGLVKGEHHESRLDRDKLSELVADAGLEEVDFRRFMFAPVSFLPYLRVPVPIRPALFLDSLVHSVPFTGWMFVNQVITARKQE